MLPSHAEHMNPNQTPYSSQNANAGPKQLRRSKTDRKISGVCGGIAEYLDVDANLVRLLVVIGTIITGGGLAIAYLVALVIMPEGPATPVWNQAANPQAPAGYAPGNSPAYQQTPQPQSQPQTPPASGTPGEPGADKPGA
jgi:phage shock protein PspC (stress-responsive transcriptional regulator)